MIQYTCKGLAIGYKIVPCLVTKRWPVDFNTQWWSSQEALGEVEKRVKGELNLEYYKQLTDITA
jgi:hypothetical protein